MNVTTLRTLLKDEFEAVEENGELSVSSSHKITILVTFGDEILRVAKVRAVRITDDFVAINGESDSIYVDVAHDFAIKSEGSEGPRDVRPGFH